MTSCTASFAGHSSHMGLILFLVQAGVITGDNVRKLFDYAKENRVGLCSFRDPVDTQGIAYP